MRRISGQKVILLLLISALVLPLSGGCKTTPVSPAPESAVKPTVSEKDPLEYLVLNSDLIVSGNITDLRYKLGTVAEGERAGWIYTVFTLTVEKVIKGEPGIGEVLIRVDGGKIAETVDGKTRELRQNPTGAYFSISDRVLLCLKRRNDNIYTVPLQGVVWERSKTSRTSPDMPVVIARIVRIMKANNIPVALPASQIPPMPATKPAPPAKK